MDALLVQFEAPIVSFGSVTVDKHGYTGLWPVRSMLTGFFGNALGYRRTQTEELSELQARLQYAVRCDRKGTHYSDYQTVTMGKMDQVVTSKGWVDLGRNDQWNGADKTFIRRPDYWTDVAYLVVVTLQEKGALSLDSLEQALKKPARVPFIGRACCHPTAPYFYGRRESDSLLDLLCVEPELPRGNHKPIKEALWPVGDPVSAQGIESVRTLRIFQDRDWKNSVHTGESYMREGRITLGALQ
jgi:CRISPR system Cascade subunit CasD